MGRGADRDRARTPLPWDGSPGGGFTEPGVTPRLPMAEHPAATVAAQRDDPGSVLSLCRRLLTLRRAELGGGIAPFENLLVTEGRWAYRTGPLVVAANFAGRAAGLGRRGAAENLRRRRDRAARRPGPLGGRYRQAGAGRVTAASPVSRVAGHRGIGNRTSVTQAPPAP